MKSQIFLGDCIKGMRGLDDSQMDLIIADPPFGINFKANMANQNRKKSLVIKGYKDVKKENYQTFTNLWILHAARILKDSGSMFIFSGYNNLRHVLNAIDNANLHTINHIIWKYQFGQRTVKKFVASHYHIIYVCKDPKKRKFNPWCRFAQNDKDDNGNSLHYQDKEDVWHIKKEYWTGEKKVPTKLPFELIKKIIQYCSNEGDVVFDPFLGSGMSAIVAKHLKRKYLGYEIVPEYYEFAKEKLK